MRRKRKKTQYPRVEASALVSTVGIDSLKKLSTEELMAALAMATDVESWQETVVKGLQKDKPDDSLIGAFIAGAMHTRVAREVMAIELTLRNERNEPPAAGNGNGKPRGPKGYL